MNMNNKYKYIYFPEDKKYIMKLIPKSVPLLYATSNDAKEVICSLKNTGDGFVTLSAEGFYSASFVDKQFEFLLFCGDVIEVPYK